jgi:pterin-4a-carbinolamine dehydratase/glycosyltransferase involved in cell wall biosynthesis
VLASVITPTLGRETLHRTLASLLAQTQADWEAIVVDDGDGGGVRIAESFGDDRIRAFRSPGRGQVDARNAAIEVARGEVVCWLDDDDWWDDEHHLARLRDTVDDRALLYRGGWIVYEQEAARREVFDLGASCRSLRTNNTVLTSSIAYPRSAHELVGPLDASLGGYCDWDLMLRLCDSGYTPRKIPGLGVCYALHGTNASAEHAAPARRQGFERLVRKHGLVAEIANHAIIREQMSSLPDGWLEVDGALEREFEFPDFLAAMAFVNRVAELAERENHHPDIRISYNRVTLRWWTHSAGGVTARDRELAGQSGQL